MSVNSAAIVLPCACANLRRAARAVTQLYDQELRGAGLHATQFTLLQVLAGAGRITQGNLGDLLAMDSTTLTRTLRLLVGKGWVRSLPGEDRRERHLLLTPAGRRELDQARPHWERAQQRLRKALGNSKWELTQASLPQMMEAAKRA
ncbi:MAG: MarR family winged helix-turn-helix transcriptional regulator [Terriglobia bacterium]